MIELSMQTSLFILDILLVTGLVIVLMVYMKYKSHMTNVFYYAYFYIFSIIGVSLILLRDYVGIFLSVIIANLFMLLGNYSLSFAVRKFNRDKIYYLRYIVFLVFYLALFVYYTYFIPNVSMRIIIYGVAASFVLFDALYSEYKTTKNPENHERVMFYVIAMILFFQLFRINQIIDNRENYSSFFDYILDAYSILFLSISYFLISTGVFSKISVMFHNMILESNRSNSSLLSNLPGFAYRCKYDEFWTMEVLSDGFVGLTGYDIEDCINNKVIAFADLIFPEFRNNIDNMWNKAIENKSKFLGEYKITRKDGTAIWIWEQGIAVYNDLGEVEALEGFITSIDERKKLENNLKFMSYHDVMTGIYNRRFIEEELIRLNTIRNLPLTVVIADINGLKFVNDTFGHEQGDELIIKASQILKSVLREDELLGRLGGDEFLIALPCTSKENAELIINRINHVLEIKSVYLKGLSMSFGFATKKDMNKSINDLIKQAEDMMYSSKTYNRLSSNRKAIDAVIATLHEKDIYSESHSHNVASYSKSLAVEAGYSSEIVNKIETAALLHDIGKIIISDSILSSHNILTESEYLEIKKHPEIGCRILQSVPEFKELSNIILSHHERIDGKGYPNGLIGDEIPLESRIIAITDAWDAMISDRLYRNSLTIEEAIDQLIINKGTQFDGELVDIFVEKVLKKSID